MRKCISPAAMINSESIYGLIYSCLMIIQFLLLASFYLPKFRIQITCWWRSNKSRKYGSLYGCCGNFCCHKHFSRVFKTLFVLHPTILPKFLINGIEKFIGLFWLEIRDLSHRKYVEVPLYKWTDFTAKIILFNTS